MYIMYVHVCTLYVCLSVQEADDRLLHLTTSKAAELVSQSIGNMYIRL